MSWHGAMGVVVFGKRASATGKPQHAVALRIPSEDDDAYGVVESLPCSLGILLGSAQ